ncbi:MAG: histone deacetylase family protein [Bacillota bacterium]
MKIFFHKDYMEQYAFDPAAEKGRLEPALAALKSKYSIQEPRSATKEEILRVHTTGHWNSVAQDDLLCHTALLAAGASIEAAETACNGEFAFALCRPPGHHASADSSWGFCYFNNIAVAITHLLHLGHINKALIVDFDLHFGDGTANIFQKDNRVKFWYSQENSRLRYLDALEKDLQNYETDLVAVSAGFDRGINDWGGMLTGQDYNTIGQLLGSYAREKCKARLFAALEGGYNAAALAVNIEAFLKGLQH